MPGVIKVRAAAKRVVRQGGATLQVSAARVAPERLLAAVEVGVSLLAGAHPPVELGIRSRPDLAYVSTPLAVPGGVVVAVDTAGLEVAEADLVIEILAAALTIAGITDATIGVPSAAEPFYINPPQYGVTLWMVAREADGEQRQTLDVGVEDAAVDWLYAGLTEGLAQVTVGGALVPMLREDARGFLRRPISPIRMHRDPDVEAGMQSFRVAGFGRIRYRADQPRYVALTVGGPACGLLACVSAAEQFRTIATDRCGDLSWAAVQVSPRGEPLPWLPPGGHMALSPEDHLGEPHWWQLLTADHLSRITDLPPEATRLAEEAVAIQFAHPAAWLDDGPARVAAHARATQALGAALAPLPI